jgi:hypothetical protein
VAAALVGVAAAADGDEPFPDPRILAGGEQGRVAGEVGFGADGEGEAMARGVEMVVDAPGLGDVEVVFAAHEVEEERLVREGAGVAAGVAVVEDGPAIGGVDCPGGEAAAPAAAQGGLDGVARCGGRVLEQAGADAVVGDGGTGGGHGAQGVAGEEMGLGEAVGIRPVQGGLDIPHFGGAEGGDGIAAVAVEAEIEGD